MLVNEGQMVCVELVAKNPFSSNSRVLFLGSIKYEVLKKVYETRVNNEIVLVEYHICKTIQWISGDNRYACCRTYLTGNLQQASSRIRANAWTECKSIVIGTFKYLS
jgi:hypothetical protein